jgi:hypothetical protein
VLSGELALLRQTIKNKSLKLLREMPAKTAQKSKRLLSLLQGPQILIYLHFRPSEGAHQEHPFD